MEHRVLFLHLVFKYRLEDVQRDVGRVIQAMKRPVHQGMHGGNALGVLVVTNETAADLLARLGPVFEGLTSLENFWCYIAPKPDDVWGRFGNVDPLVHRVRKAWVEAWERSKPQNVRHPQRRDRRVNHRIKHG